MTPLETPDRPQDAERSEIAVEVAYALPQEQFLRALLVAPGTTVEAAIRASGVLDHYPEIDLVTSKVGIFGKLTTLDKPLRAGDRVEIYRPLIADPKAVRAARAAQGKVTKKGGGDAAGGDEG